MPDYLSLFVRSGALSTGHNKYIASQLVSLNDYTVQHGIVLSQKDCNEIAQVRAELLIENERIEMGVGAAQRIIEEFCDSGYVDQHTFKDTVEELLECFYTIKNETDDKVDDETVINFLKFAFEATGGDVSKIYMLDIFANYIRKINSDKDKK